MYAGTGPANIFGERTPSKKLADLHPRQVNLGTSKKQFFRGANNLSSLHKIGWRSAEKEFSLFSNMLLSMDIPYSSLYVSMSKSNMSKVKMSKNTEKN
jgi:hypothetical protein